VESRESVRNCEHSSGAGRRIFIITSFSLFYVKVSDGKSSKQISGTFS
jgi:hypothetical protein